MNSVDDTLELQLYLFLFARFHLPLQFKWYAAMFHNSCYYN